MRVLADIAGQLGRDGFQQVLGSAANLAAGMPNFYTYEKVESTSKELRDLISEYLARQRVKTSA